VSGWLPMLLLTIGCWVVRVLFTGLVPALRPHPRTTSTLGSLGPAVLAALISLDVSTGVRSDDASTTLTVLGCVAVIAVVAHWRPNLAVSAVLGLVSIVLIDLVLP
jgi:branched-subunit amino acid transport protein